eukprot:gene27655-36466_t
MSCDFGSSFYDVLGISPMASLTEIKQSYRKLALKYHPDRNLGDVDYATEIFKRIAEAYSILSDEGSRINYDNKLKSAVSLTSSNFNSKQDPSNDYSFYKTNSASVPTAPAWAKNSSPHYNTTPSYSPPEPNPIIFSCSFSIRKAHIIFNDFFADFEEFEGGEVRNPYLSIKNRNQTNERNQLVSYNPSVARNIRYSHSMSPSEQRLYRNVDNRDKFKNSTFNSWNPSGDSCSDSPKPATQFLYVFGTDSEKNRNLKLVHRRRNMV